MLSTLNDRTLTLIGMMRFTTSLLCSVKWDSDKDLLVSALLSGQSCHHQVTQGDPG